MLEEQALNISLHDHPGFRMGRLACSAAHHGQGLGKLLLGCAVERCLQARKQVAAFAMVADAKDDSAKAFISITGLRPVRIRR